MTNSASKPKAIERHHRFSDEKAISTGVWPFTFGEWRITHYPYAHENGKDIVWLECDIEHIHLFVEQNVKMCAGFPEWSQVELKYVDRPERPYCYLCGVMMSDELWEHHQRAVEMVALSVKGT